MVVKLQYISVSAHVCYSGKDCVQFKYVIFFSIATNCNLFEELQWDRSSDFHRISVILLEATPLFDIYLCHFLRTISGSHNLSEKFRVFSEQFCNTDIFSNKWMLRESAKHLKDPLILMLVPTIEYSEENDLFLKNSNGFCNASLRYLRQFTNLV